MGDTAWVLTSAALVLFMVPGLALFYGGMVRSKNVLNMLNMNIYCLGVIPIVWAALGWTLASSGDNNFIGDFDAFWLNGVTGEGAVREFAFLMTFACITPALISGAVADRMKFSAWMIFVPVWSLLVYSPVVRWVYGGWIGDMPAHDFAGGTAIHINAGVAALALSLVLGKRKGWGTEAFPPHNLPLVLLGTGILWFGWFGFNGGSALAADGAAAQAFLNTFLGGAAGLVGWMIMDVVKTGKVTTLGMCSGIVAGLVAITPAAGFVGSMSSLIFGLAAGIACFFAVKLKDQFGFDDSLDVVGIHMVGGIIGGLLLGFLANRDAFEGSDFLEGGGELFLNQLISIVAVLVYSFVVTFILAKILDAVIGLRVSAESEQVGLDTTEHAETAYLSGDVGMGRVG